MPDTITGLSADYLARLPEVLQEILEIQTLANCLNPELDSTGQTAKATADILSVQLANIDGVARWEKILGVTTPLNSSLKARRDALLAKLSTKPPINLTMLSGLIETYMGVPVDLSAKDFVLSIMYRGETKIPDLSPLYATLYDTIPANLTVTVVYNWVTWGEAMSHYPTWNSFKARTWDNVRKEI